MAACAPSLHSASGTWGNTGTEFTNAASWVSANLPGAAGNLGASDSGARDVATFSGAADADYQPYVSENWTLGELVFTGSGYNLTGEAGVFLRLNTNTTTSGNSFTRVIGGGNTSGTNTINVDLRLGQGAGSNPVRRVDILQQSGGTLVINGKISDAAAGWNNWGISIHNREASGVGRVEFNNTANDFARRVLIGFNEGLRNGSVTLAVKSVGLAGQDSSLGRNSVVQIGANTRDLSTTHTLNYTGAGETSDKNFILDLGRAGVSTYRVIDTTGSTGNLVLTGNITGGVTYTSAQTFTSGMQATLRLTGTNEGDAITGVISDRSDTLRGLIGTAAADAPADARIALNKQGAGVWTLSGLNTYTGNTTVDEGGLVIADTGALTFALANGGAGNLVTVASGAFFDFNGTLALDLSGLTAVSAGDSWTLVTGAGAASYGASFSVTATGLTFAESGDIWTSNDGLWSFSEATGVLTATAVPEPAVFASILGAAALAGAAFRRRA